MTFEVYALREIGSPGMRYVGQTGKGRTARMNFLANLGRLGLGEVEMREWLWSCNFAIEAILLKEVATREEAKAVERLAIELFWFAGHRLVNLQGRPKAPRKAPIVLPSRAARGSLMLRERHHTPGILTVEGKLAQYDDLDQRPARSPENEPGFSADQLTSHAIAFDRQPGNIGDPDFLFSHPALPIGRLIEVGSRKVAGDGL